MATRVAPAAIHALKEALAAIYWFKRDLRAFLATALDDPGLLAQLNWDDYKYNVVGDLVDRMVGQPRHQEELMTLMVEVARMDDFQHLARLEDGGEKVKRARQAIAHLRNYTQPYEEVVRERTQAQERIEAQRAAAAATQGVADKLAALRERYVALVGADDKQRRGYDLQDVLEELFELFDLAPKGSFAIAGEQIDGAFNFVGTEYLLEARWRAERADTADLDGFAKKIERKLENTLGLLISIEGFQENAVKIHSGGKPVMVLMDGADLFQVLDARIDLPELLRRKIRHAATTGSIMLSVGDILG